MKLREDLFPRFDIHKQGQLLIDTITKASAELQALDVTHATYMMLPNHPHESGQHIMNVDVPLDEFPYERKDVTISEGSNVDKFNLVLMIVEGTVKIETEMTIEELLDGKNRKILDALSADSILKLVNKLEGWYNEKTRSLEAEYGKKEPEMITWYLSEPCTILRRQALRQLSQVLRQKTEST